MKKRIAATTGAIATMLTLTACAGEEWDPTDESHFTPQVITVDGHEVKCVLYRMGHAGGLSCDWENAR